MVMNGDNNIDFAIEMYEDMRVIRVPQTRFYTSISLANPSAHDGAGGYSCNGAGINYMIVHPSAVKNAVKLALPKVFSPDENQTADAWKFQYREYHDAFVLANKVNGIYVHCANTANS